MATFFFFAPPRKSKQKEKSPRFSLFSLFHTICLTEIFWTRRKRLKQTKISYKFYETKAEKKGTHLILPTNKTTYKNLPKTNRT